MFNQYSIISNISNKPADTKIRKTNYENYY